MWDCTFNNNTAVLSGGALFCDDDTDTTFNGCQLNNNRAFVGGAIATRGHVNLSNCTLIGNSATSRGGGVADDGSSVIYLYNTTLINNTAATGAGLTTGYTLGAASITCVPSTFIGNAASQNGGAISSDIGGSVNISSSQFYNNSAAQAGAVWFGLSKDGPTMRNNTFANSTATCCYAAGYGFELDSHSGTGSCSDTDSGSGEANCCTHDQYSDGSKCLRCLERGNCSSRQYISNTNFKSW
jgi:predicted outer membrane repeat protein